jgi:hypothetical protein
LAAIVASQRVAFRDLIDISVSDDDDLRILRRDGRGDPHAWVLAK